MSSRDQGTAALVRMANQIAGNMAHLPHDEAVTAVAKHLRDFWHPSMRESILAYVDDGGDGLVPVAREAVERLR